MLRETATAGTYHHLLFAREELRIRIVTIQQVLEEHARFTPP